MERYPIRLFKCRVTDNRLTEGFGNTGEEKWLLSGEDLKNAGESLCGNFDVVVKGFDFKDADHRSVPFVYAAKLKADDTSKTKRRHVEQLFDAGSGTGVIGMKDSGELIVQLKTEDQAKAVKSHLQAVDQYNYGISCLDSIVPFVPERVDVADSPSGIWYKLRLVNFPDDTVMKKLKEIICEACNDLEVSFPNYAPNLMIASVAGERAAAVCDRLRRLGALLSAEPMPCAVLDRSPTGAAKVVMPIARDESKEYPTLGILDSGIAESGCLDPWVVARRTVYPVEDTDNTHGSMVAGMAVYADRLAGAEWIGQKNGINLVDAQVVSNGYVREAELIDNIEESIKAHPEVRVWNLSVSIDCVMGDDGFTDFGKALDRIQHEHKVLICKSAGNTDTFVAGLPPERLLAGADSLLALTVGSIAHEHAEADLANVGERSPFSRVGPGPESVIKPEVVHYGGNCAVVNGKLIQNGVKTVAPNGTEAAVCGTSFSTPMVGAIAAELFHELGEDADSLLVKALLVHSARYLNPSPVKLADCESLAKEIGYGRPKVAAQILHDDPNSATFVMRDELVKGGWLQLTDFPMPKSLIRDGHFTGDISITVVTDPLLDPSQGREYCQSELEVKFGTFKGFESRDMSKRNVRNEFKLAGAQNLLLPEIYSNQKMKKNAELLRERMLIRFGKYHPVKKFSLNLGAARDKQLKNALGADSRWYLQLKSVFRSQTESRIVRPAQRFCTIITVHDSEGDGTLNHEMLDLMVRAKLYAGELTIRSEVPIEVRG